MSIESLLALDIKIFLTIIIVGGALFTIYIIYRIKKQDDMNKEFWKELKENDRHYHQTDKMHILVRIKLKPKSKTDD